MGMRHGGGVGGGERQRSRAPGFEAGERVYHARCIWRLIPIRRHASRMAVKLGTCRSHFPSPLTSGHPGIVPGSGDAEVTKLLLACRLLAANSLNHTPR